MKKSVSIKQFEEEARADYDGTIQTYREADVEFTGAGDCPLSSGGLMALWHVVSHRYEELKPTVVIFSVPYKEVPGLWSDNADTGSMAEAIVNRLLEMNLDGEGGV